jgi:hypothetical protein
VLWGKQFGRDAPHVLQGAKTQVGIIVRVGWLRRKPGQVKIDGTWERGFILSASADSL